MNELRMPLLAQPSKCIAFLDRGSWKVCIDKALRYELVLRGFSSDEELPLLLQYKELQIDGQRVDLLVERRVIVELKCADKFAPIHEAILLSYLKTMKLRLGLMLNFKLVTLKEGGIKRVVL